MQKHKSLASLALTCLFFAISVACNGAEPAKSPNKPGAIPGQSGFVTVKGRHFQLDGKPYYFAGANLWYGMYLGSPGQDRRSRAARRRSWISSPRRASLNLRVLAISEASTLKRAVTPAVMQSPDAVDETLWQGLDFLLDEMARRDMKAVLYLNNFWQWSGGMSQYMAWFNGKPVRGSGCHRRLECLHGQLGGVLSRAEGAGGIPCRGQTTDRAQEQRERPQVQGRPHHHVLAARQRAAARQRCQRATALRRVREVGGRDRGLHQETGAEAAREHRQRGLDGHGGLAANCS